MILNKRPTSEIKRAAKEDGMTFLRESAVLKDAGRHHDACERSTRSRSSKGNAMALTGMSLADTLKSILQEPPPAMAFEISEAGIAAARIGAARGAGFPCR